MSHEEESGPPQNRRSACAQASLQQEIERVRKMSVEERILAALNMKSKFAGLQPTPIVEPNDEPS